MTRAPSPALVAFPFLPFLLPSFLLSDMMHDAVVRDAMISTGRSGIPAGAAVFYVGHRARGKGESIAVSLLSRCCFLAPLGRFICSRKHGLEKPVSDRRLNI